MRLRATFRTNEGLGCEGFRGLLIMWFIQSIYGLWSSNKGKTIFECSRLRIILKFINRNPLLVLEYNSGCNMMMIMIITWVGQGRFFTRILCFKENSCSIKQDLTPKSKIEKAMTRCNPNILSWTTRPALPRTHYIVTIHSSTCSTLLLAAQ